MSYRWESQRKDANSWCSHLEDERMCQLGRQELNKCCCKSVKGMHMKDIGSVQGQCKLSRLHCSWSRTLELNYNKIYQSKRSRLSYQSSWDSQLDSWCIVQLLSQCKYQGDRLNSKYFSINILKPNISSNMCYLNISDSQLSMISKSYWWVGCGSNQDKLSSKL